MKLWLIHISTRLHCHANLPKLRSSKRNIMRCTENQNQSKNGKKLQERIIKSNFQRHLRTKGCRLLRKESKAI